MLETVLHCRISKPKCQLQLVIVKQDGPTLLGKNWLYQIRLDWPELTKQIHEKALDPILDQFQEVFRDELGTFNKADCIRLNFYKPRPLPYAMRDKVEHQLQCLQTAGIIEPVESSEWAAPVVPVLKRDKKTLRLCGDYRLTINQAVKLDQYPIPKIEDLLTKIAGGRYFTSLDMSQAYQQLLLHDESKKLAHR